MKKLNKLILIISISLLSLFFGVATLLREPELTSVMEARKSTTFSDFIDAGLTRDISTNFEKAFADQMVFRDRFIELNARVELMFGKRVIGDVLVNCDGQLIRLPVESSNKYIEDNINDLELIKASLRSRKIPLIYVELPRKWDIYRDVVPNYYYTNYNYSKPFRATIDDNKYIDIVETIYNNKRNNYYRTDHHMNMNGIFLVYGEIVKSINETAFNIGNSKNKDDFQIESYSEVFVGSDGRKATRSSVDTPDTIEIYNSKKNFNTEARLYPSDKTVNIFQKNRINKYDYYNNDYVVYIGGDVNICLYNEDAVTDKTAIIVGNSFDNPLVPLMSIHFQKICHFDYRKIDKKLIGKIDEIKPDLVIMSYDHMASSAKDAFSLLKQLTK